VVERPGEKEMKYTRKTGSSDSEQARRGNCFKFVGDDVRSLIPKSDEPRNTRTTRKHFDANGLNYRELAGPVFNSRQLAQFASSPLLDA
jgi:hypothetical protein